MEGPNHGLRAVDARRSARNAPRSRGDGSALTLPEICSELTGVGGWTADEYEAWLATILRRELLAAG